jgi:hypothetical protein
MGLMRNRNGQKETWEQALSGLALPASPWTVEDLLRAYVEQIRGRRLILSRDQKVASVNGPSGMWFPGPDADLVWAHPAVSGVQYAHVLGHELGHMVNGDEPDKLDLTSVVRLLMGACSTTPGLLQSALAGAGVQCRADGTSSEQRERQAEDFGYYVERWVTKNGPRGATLLETNMRASLDT